MAEYEFSDAENVEIRELASKMSFVGTVGAIFGFLVALAGVGMAFALPGALAMGMGQIGQGAVAFFVGVWTRAAARSFQQIVDTQGKDMTNLHAALAHLRRIYGLQRILYIAALVLLAIVVAFAIATSLRASP